MFKFFWQQQLQTISPLILIIQENQKKIYIYKTPDDKAKLIEREIATIFLKLILDNNLQYKLRSQTNSSGAQFFVFALEKGKKHQKKREKKEEKKTHTHTK